MISVGRIERGKGRHVIPITAKETPKVKYIIISAIGEADYLQHVTAY
ncbi:MAG: hypothetical protein QXJ64_06190 [Thermosphaera sp.]